MLKPTTILLLFISFWGQLFGQKGSLNVEVPYAENAEWGSFPERGYQNQNGDWFSVVSLEVSEKPDFGNSRVKLLDYQGNVIEIFPIGDVFSYGVSRGIGALTGDVPALVNGKKIHNVAFDLSYKKGGELKAPQMFSSSSVLADGNWFKLKIPKRGVYRLTHTFLKANGIDLSGNTSNMGVFGNGLGMLPFDNSISRPGGLVELATYQKGLNDGSFDNGDYVVFADPGQESWSYSNSFNFFVPDLSIYDDFTYVYFTTDRGSLKKVQNSDFAGVPNLSTTTFDSYSFYGQDLVNLVESGRIFYGELFDFTDSYRFNFNYLDKDPNKDIKVLVDFASRTLGDQSSIMELRVNGELLSQKNAPGIGASDYAEAIRFGIYETYSTNSENGALAVDLTFLKNAPSSRAWLDRIVLNYRRKLRFAGGEEFFRDKSLVDSNSVVEYSIDNASSSVLVWEVGSFVDPINHPLTLSGNTGSFVGDARELREYVMFNPGNAPVPEFIKRMEPQNLHAVSTPDYVIVCPEFLNEAAEELAEIHREDGLDVLVVDPALIYGEFSSGSQDITGIKDFMRMLYQRDPVKLKYLLLFGDGSYKNKNTAAGRSNLIPTYQSVNSEHRLDSYVSDDYYGLLDENEGENPIDLIDLGIGRFPVGTLPQAKAMVEKIKRYKGISEVDENPYGNWRSRVVFVSDDFDGGRSSAEKYHTNQADILASIVSDSVMHYLPQKLYMALYQQETTPGGERYPEGQRRIKENVDNGALMVNYTGHGGEVGWAHERILDIPTIINWRNNPRLPLFVTATCEFTRWDDPNRVSGGELVFLNERGGGIGLLSTTRVVFSLPNFVLNKAFFEWVFRKDSNNEYLRLGDILPPTKSAATSSGTFNHRNFSLIGDPALRLNYPKGQVSLTKFNNQDITSVPDTVKALGRVQFSGLVKDAAGMVDPSFNGEVEVVVFDKKDSLLTLNNDKFGVEGYMVRNSAIFKGRFSVTNGEFDVNFVAPKDISFLFQTGLVSVYAFDPTNKKDALGSYQAFVIGGTSTDALNDNVGPDLQLFINDKSFVDGSITSENPVLIVEVDDNFGINTTGNGLGHDLTAVLDGNTNQTVVLNSYYEGKLDSSASGKMEYRYEGLEPGKHELKVKVWDVNNNSTEKSISLVVNENKKVELDHVLNYPNPFTTSTGFFFEHNQAEKELNVEIKIFSMNGRLVRVIKESAIPNGFRYGPIAWDGRDEFGQQLGKGVYMYQLNVTNNIGASASKMEKLVVLK
ncbi:MAG: hypothetical protein ACJAY8_000509 [Sphingobacteriales bacterium]|jgi:hypothetical protein